MVDDSKLRVLRSGTRAATASFLREASFLGLDFLGEGEAPKLAVNEKSFAFLMVEMPDSA